MKNALFGALAMVMALAMPAQALDLRNMTETERQMLRAEIRAYLLENPQVIMEAVAVLEQRNAKAQAEDDKTRVAANAEALFEAETAWVGGNPAGDVTLVEFMDYRCGYCRRAAPDVNALVEGDGNIRFILMEFPILGEQSVLSSRFAIATRQVAGDAAYKSVHDALLAFDGDVNKTALKRLGDALGLDTPAIMAAMDSPQVSRTIAEARELAQRLGLTGTPSFVLGDQILRGYMPRAAMEELVTEIRADG